MTFQKILLAAGCALMTLATPAASQQVTNNQNFGFNLPTAPRSNGFDEVRASDGTTCRSAMSGNGAYLDVGGIAGQSDGGGSFDSGTVYGRMIIPLGERPGRIDCRSLFQLEIDRLKHELQMVKSGMNSAESAGSAGWQKEGWNNN